MENKKTHNSGKKVLYLNKLAEQSDFLEEFEYGTLGLCKDNIPYLVPLNFVILDNEVYFHGAKKGKKIDFIKANDKACFSLLKDYSLLPSYFSTDSGKACPATQLFKSLYIEGEIKLIEDYNQKAKALEALMQKLQKEGKYIPLDNKEVYEKMINATALFKLSPETISCKIKMGQNFNEERYNRVKEHLEKRATKKDLESLKLLEEYRRA